jgi:CRISPR-associated protein Csm3
MTEWKFENGIDRITAAANPRQVERVPAGSKFKFELIYTVEDIQQTKEDLLNLAIALHILEQDALGGHGSRGYGKVTFHGLKLSYQEYSKYLPKPDPRIHQFNQFVDSLSIEEDGLKSPMEMMDRLEQKQLPEVETSTSGTLSEANESGDA